MKKYINRKRYDTETARVVGHHEHSYRSEFDWADETLYCKRGGQYFLAGRGGPESRYCKKCATGGLMYGENIFPLTEEEARDWAERYLEPDEVEAEWGEPVEDDREAVKALVSPEAKAALRAICAATGETQGQAIERMILAEHPQA